MGLFWNCTRRQENRIGKRWRAETANATLRNFETDSGSHAGTSRGLHGEDDRDAGILTADGKLEQLSVKKSPDPQVHSVVTDALSNWTFQPSQVDGKPVALKIMMGIRLIAR